MRVDGEVESACGDSVCGCLEEGWEVGMASSRGCMGFAESMGMEESGEQPRGKRNGGGRRKDERCEQSLTKGGLG